MKRRYPHEETARTVGLALALWALAVIAGSLAGVFAKLALVELVALTAFGSVFATATAWLDRGVHAAIERLGTRALFTVAVEADLFIAMSAMLAAPLVEGGLAVAITRVPLALVAYFGVPLAAAAHLVLLERLLRPATPVHARRGTPSAAA